MNKNRRNLLLIFIALFFVGFWFLKIERKSIVDVSESSPKYFLVIYGDKWLKISKSKSDIYSNKFFEHCPESVVVPLNEEVKIIKPKAWKNIYKKDNVTN